MHHFHLDLHKIHLIKNELQEVYLNLIIQSFALSMITIFVPVYLIKLGFSINQAFIFVILEVGLLSLFTPVSLILAQRFGFKHIIAYRLPLILAYFAGLYALEYFSIPLYFIAFLGGLNASIYWCSLHSLFAKNSDKIHRGIQSGKMISLPNFAALLGPTLGGIIAATLGFKTLFLISMFLVVLSVVPLFFTGDMKPHVKKVNYRNMFNPKHMKFVLLYSIQGVIIVMSTVVWPLFVYFTLSDVLSVGFVGTLTAIGTIAFVLIAGKLSDRMSRYFLIKVGGILLGLTFFLRIFIKDSTNIFIISFIAGLSRAIVDVPIRTIFYDTANSDIMEEVVILRQAGLFIGRAGSLIFLLWVLNKFTIGFSLAGAASMLLAVF